MILLIMVVLLIAFLCAWFGRRTSAISVFTLSFILAIFWFLHDVTVDIGLSL